MFKQMFMEHKILSSWCLILIILLIPVLYYIRVINWIGEAGYYLYLLFSIFVTLLGVPLFILFTMLEVFLIWVLVREYPSFKTKKGFTKKGKKELKGDLFIITMVCVPLLIILFFSYFGVHGIYEAYMDYKYLKNPQNIVLTTWQFERSHSRRFGVSYRLIGIDSQLNEYDFLIGKHRLNDMDNHFGDIEVYYLPNTNIMMSIEKK